MLNVVTDVEFEIKSLMKPVGSGKWSCVKCQYESWSSNVYNHVESKHVGNALYWCQLCQKELKGRNSFNGHMSRYHKK